MPTSPVSSPVHFQNVNELKQHLLDVSYYLEQSIVDSVINQRYISLQACSRIKQNILSKFCNNINNWLNQQPLVWNLIC